MAPRDGADERARRSGVFRVERTLPSLETHRTWDETSAYLLDRAEVGQLLDDLAPMVTMGREAVDFLLEGEWGTLGIPRTTFEQVRDSFDSEELEFITRYDFAHMGQGEYKLVGIDADSPRGVLETAQVQRTWLWDKFAERTRTHQVSQLNSIPELAMEALRQLRTQSRFPTLTLAQTGDEAGEDWLTTSYVKGLAESAGWDVRTCRVRDLRWLGRERAWVDGDGRQVTTLYKNAPWDMMLRQAAARDLLAHGDHLENLFEPPWKLILSNRAMLPALWELFPRSPLLSPASIVSAEGLGPNTVTSTLMPTSSRTEMGTLRGRPFTSWADEPKDFSSQRMLAHRRLEVPKRHQDRSGVYRFTYLSLYTVAGTMAGISFRETRMPLLGTHSTVRPHLVQL